jgi:septum formation protein
MDIILASSSTYRRRLLERLQIGFRCLTPDTDESRLPNESPPALSQRLAIAKARAIAEIHPDALAIGSDQVASIEGDILGKPGGFSPAVEQLRLCSGREVRFFTTVAVVSLHQGLERFHVEPFSVFFRRLSEVEIANYLHRDEPYDCAGSFKVECLGIALFKRLTGNDPTSLEGLPLIALTELLRNAGVDVFSGLSEPFPITRPQE